MYSDGGWSASVRNGLWIPGSGFAGPGMTELLTPELRIVHRVITRLLLKQEG